MRRHLVWSVALGLGTAGLVIAVSWIVAQIVAARFGLKPVSGLIVGVLIAYLLRAIIARWQAVVAERASVRVKTELRNEIVADLTDPRRLGPRPAPAKLVTILGPGMDAFDGYIGRFLPQLVLSVLVPAAVIAAMAWTDLLSGLIVVFTLPLIVIFMVLVGKLTGERVQRRWAAMERLGRHFGDVLAGLTVFKIFGRPQAAGIKAIGERHRAESMAALRMAFLSTLVLEFLSTISVALVAVSVGLRVVDDEMILVDAMFVLLLAPEAYLPVRRVGTLFHDSQEGVEATASLLAILEHDRHAGREDAPPGPALIRMRDVRVAHPDRNELSLNLPLLELRPGEKVALVGPSGSGKSTAMAVLLAFTRPQYGQVEVGDQNLFSIDPASWRRNIAWVPQEPQVFAGTLAQNVSFASPTASMAEVQRALNDVGLQYLDSNRQLREGAGTLSAGERRRLALARAVLRVRTTQACLILLDEPTAGLDASREAQVVETLSALGATVVLVTHRPETLALADRTVHLDVSEVRT